MVYSELGNVYTGEYKGILCMCSQMFGQVKMQNNNRIMS